MPIKADNLMVKYKISEGKVLGDKLKMIEEEWVKNNFQISDQQVENIVNNQIYLTSLISKFFIPAGVLISTKSFLFFPIKPFPIGD